MTAENRITWIIRMLLMAGTVEILVGILHFIMPMFAYESPGFRLLSENEIAFVSLCVHAIGILLVAFGCLTIVVAAKAEAWKGLLLPFLTVKSPLWCARVGLEICFPVVVPLFYIQRPTSVVMPLLIMEALLFVVPAAYVSYNRTRWLGPR